MKLISITSSADESYAHRKANAEAEGQAALSRYPHSFWPRWICDNCGCDRPNHTRQCKGLEDAS